MVEMEMRGDDGPDVFDADAVVVERLVKVVVNRE
jgi:hypothetical protein